MPITRLLGRNRPDFFIGNAEIVVFVAANHVAPNAGPCQSLSPGYFLERRRIRGIGDLLEIEGIYRLALQ